MAFQNIDFIIIRPSFLFNLITFNYVKAYSLR